MKYPGLSTTLRLELTSAEWGLIANTISTVDSLGWHENARACQLLEEAAKEAIKNNYFKCAAKILYYYDHFFTS